MSRQDNNVRGPTSALTEFLRESGITPTTIARRARTRAATQAQAEAGPSNAAQDQQTEANGDANGDAIDEDFDSDNLDEPVEEAPKRRKTSKAADKGKGKKTAAKKKPKKKDDDGDYEDEDNDPYTALSKMWKDELPKPPVGSFEKCAKCAKQFTVTKYTLPANPPPGWLCHPCSKESGDDPFKKPAAPRKRKAFAEKRVVVHFEERRLPTLASLCIQLITQHIDDVEALGDIGSINMDEIAKAIAGNRSLTPQNAPLFYDVQNANLTMYDVTNFPPPALCTLASLNPNLTTLRLDYCGRMDDSVVEAWSIGLPNLKRLELLGPFLVKAPAWQIFFKTHPNLEGFLITQSPRFDMECMRVLTETCQGLSELRLKEVGKMSDELLECLKSFTGTLTSLDLSYPGNADAVSEIALIELLSVIGPSLTYLNLSGIIDITDKFLYQGLKPHARKLTSLALANVPDLTSAGVAEFFGTWKNISGQDGMVSSSRLAVVDLSRCHFLGGDALEALLEHSGEYLTHLNINGWKEVPEASLKKIAKCAQDLRRIDLGFCREVDDWVVKALLEKCEHLEEIQIWGCQRVTANCPRKRNVRIYGAEAHTVA